MGPSRQSSRNFIPAFHKRTARSDIISPVQTDSDPWMGERAAARQIEDTRIPERSACSDATLVVVFDRWLVALWTTICGMSELDFEPGRAHIAANFRARRDADVDIASISDMWPRTSSSSSRRHFMNDTARILRCHRKQRPISAKFAWFSPLVTSRFRITQLEEKEMRWSGFLVAFTSDSRCHDTQVSRNQNGSLAHCEESHRLQSAFRMERKETRDKYSWMHFPQCDSESIAAKTRSMKVVCN